MAGGASSSSAISSSFSSSVFTHDAFLSFRGEDTRYGFTGNLYSALDHRGIFTFFDDKELRIGNEIRPSLLSAIERSRTAIVVLSKDYASSSFCLDELAKIMECVHGQGRLVIPIFYEVAPTHVRHLTGTYGDALNAHENKFKANKDKFNGSNNMDRLQRWREALKQVADLSGYHFQHGGYEYQFISNIVEQVSRQIRPRLLLTDDHPVGLDFPVYEITKLLDLGSDDIRMVGIHGIGGVGKTTLAVAVYNEIVISVEHLSFRLCFMGNVRENSERHGLPHLQKIVLSELFGEQREVTCVEHGISILKRKLKGEKILLVLDDVDQEKQLKALAGESNWFGRGSRVIITTRDINLLSRYEDKITYEVKTLNEKDAIELLRSKALRTNQVDLSFMDILNEVVTYASGLPLALKVIGSNLVGKSIEQWKSALCQYKKIPKNEIQTILVVSYNALEEFEKEIFLDIACCLKGYKLKDVKEILCAHHSVDSLDYALRVLVEKSLIKTHAYQERVTLHDLIQDMGREIVRKESSKNPGKRSRLWLLEDIVQVFERNEGTDKIEMIHMDFPIFEKVINWDGEAFKKMPNIRTLIIEHACFSQGPKLLPNSLRVLKWQQYPSHSLPIGFYPEELVIFQLRVSRLMSVEFSHKQKFKSLTVIDFSRSNIEEIPDVSGVPNLEELRISFCTNLIKVHESVGFLDKLKLLDTRACKRLTNFPPIELTNLEHLRLEHCSNLKNFPEILGEMENISKIALYSTSIKELPSSIAYLSKLRKLNLGNSATTHLSINSIAMLPCLEELVFGPSYRGLQFPKLDEGEEQRSSMLSPNAIKVSLRDCNMSDEYWPVLVAWFRNVVELDLAGNNFTVLPESIQELCSLRRLDLTGCKKLQEIRGIPPNMNDFVAVECISLTCSSKMMLLNEEFHKDGNKLVDLPGSTIPEWFEHNNIQHNSISFRFRNKLPEICLCLADDDYVQGITNWRLSINGKYVSEVRVCDKGLYEEYTKKNKHITIIGLKRLAKLDHGNNEMDEFLSENEWNHVECRFDRIRVIIGVHVINHKSSMEDDIQFTNPGYDFKLFPRSLPHSLPILGEMENISKNAVYCTSIKELPSSIAYLSKLRKLTLGNSATSLSISSIAMLPCLEELSFVPFDERLQFAKLDEGEEQRSSMLSPNDIKVSLRDCNLSDEYWPVLVAWFRNVVELNLAGNNFTVLPESIQELCSLRRLDLTGCKKLQEIRGIPPDMNDFVAVECISLTCSSKMMLLNEEFHKDGNKLVDLPGSTIPEWFEHNNIQHNSISFRFRNKLPKICLCLADDHYVREQTMWILSINGKDVSEGFVCNKGMYEEHTKNKHITIIGLKRLAKLDHGNNKMDKFLLENEWNHVECRFCSIGGIIGVHVINHKSSMEDDIQLTNPGYDFQLLPGLWPRSLPILGEMENISETVVYCTSIKELPSSIAYLSKLRKLTLGNSATSLSISSIAMLPCLEELSFVPFDERLQFPKLDEGEEQRSSMLSPNDIKVSLRDCNMSDEYWPVLVAWFRNVVELNLAGNNFTVLPESIQELCSLRRLDLTGCKKLQEIGGIPPNMNDFVAVECISLTCSSKMMLLNEEFHKDGNKLVDLPGSTIPEWFEHNNIQHNSISFRFRNKLPKICLYLADDHYVREQTMWILSINGKDISEGFVCNKGMYEEHTKNKHITIIGLKRLAKLDHGNNKMDKFLSENEWNHVECRFSSIGGIIGVHVINHKSSMQDDIQLTNPGYDFQLLPRSLPRSLPMNSGDHPPAEENSLKDYVSNSVAQIGISSNTTNNVQENTTLESSQAPPSDITSGEEHLGTCCTKLPTSDVSFRTQIDSNQDNDVEMEKFYASLDSGSHVLPCSHDHSATMAPNKEAREALKIVQDFITNNDASVFLDLEQCSIMKTNLDCLSNLSENGGLSEETRALVSEASRVFTQCNSNYIEANMKVESSASKLLRADELKADLEDNKYQFKEVMALGKKQRQKLACLEESKKELEKQINAINANILVSQSEHNMSQKRKRDIFEEGKTLKTQADKLKEKVPYLQHEQDLAKETQEKIKAEWSGLGEKFRKIVVE